MLDETVSRYIQIAYPPMVVELLNQLREHYNVLFAEYDESDMVAVLTDKLEDSNDSFVTIRDTIVNSATPILSAHGIRMSIETPLYITVAVIGAIISAADYEGDAIAQPGLDSIDRFSHLVAEVTEWPAGQETSSQRIASLLERVSPEFIKAIQDRIDGVVDIDQAATTPDKIKYLKRYTEAYPSLLVSDLALTVGVNLDLEAVYYIELYDDKWADFTPREVVYSLLGAYLMSNVPRTKAKALTEEKIHAWYGMDTVSVEMFNILEQIDLGTIEEPK